MQERTSGPRCIDMENLEPRKILFRELRVAFLKRGYYSKDIAAALHMAAGGLSARLNGKTPWNLSEIYEICDLLKIPYSEIPAYFPKEDVMA